MRRYIILSTVTTVSIFAAAYKLPEQSIAGTALGAANVASCSGADCAYYNSANSIFLEPNKQFIEAGLTYVHLPKIEYKGSQILNGNPITATAKSKSEDVAIPYFHYISKAYGDYRFALSMTVPGGLTKRWDSPVQKLFAQKFELKTIMVNPSIAYRANKNLAISAGISAVYSKGKVNNDGNSLGLPIKREMSGDSIDYGYNLSASLQLDNGLNLAATYRSKIKLSEEGDATLYLGNLAQKYNAKVNIYLPATLTLAVSKDIYRTSLEFVYERTFWSSYKSLDFKYDKPIHPVLKDAFGTPKVKNWRDTNTFRVGLKYKYSNNLTVMAGYSYDQTPIREKYISYELPDSNAHIFSTGFIYKQNQNLSWGASILYDYKKERTIKNNINGINGKFSKGGAILVTAGFRYKF